MRILVTGAAGFIGSNLVVQLIKDGHTVVGVDSYSDVLYSSSIKIDRISKIQKTHDFEFHKLDIAADSMQHIGGPFDAIVNEAALPGQILSWNRFDAYSQNNLTSTERMIQFCLKHSIPKFVQASTSSVYGTIVKGNEMQQLLPASPYGVTKLAAENLLYAYAQSYPLDFSIVRYFSVFGPSQRPDMGIYKFIDSISHGKEVVVYGDGTQRRDCTFVADIVAGTISAITRGKKGQIYNLAGGTDVSVLEMITLCTEIIGKDPIMKFVNRPAGDQLITRADYSKAKEHLFYDPQFSFKSGLTAQIKWQLG
jgi:nucleoside-diphosphate-sugar epimerase